MKLWSEDSPITKIIGTVLGSLFMILIFWGVIGQPSLDEFITWIGKLAIGGLLIFVGYGIGFAKACDSHRLGGKCRRCRDDEKNKPLND